MVPSSIKHNCINFEEELAPVPNPAIFSAGLGVMSNDQMLDAGNERMTVMSLDEFITDAWTRFLKENHDFKGRSWLTKRFLGSIKISGGEMEPIAVSPL